MPNRSVPLYPMLNGTLSFFPLGNVAYGKPSYQSGTYGELHAKNGVDGYLGTGGDDHCAHPNHPNGEKAWFYVDLEKMHQIYNVTVFNTFNGGGKVTL